jgi:hypothetical protein
METLEALKIVRALAKGISLAEHDGPVQELVRQQLEAAQALAKAASALEAEEKRSVRKSYLPLKVGKPWSSAEEQQLRIEFAREMTIQEIARTHGRLRGGITARLERLGLIPSQLTINFTHPFGVSEPNREPASRQDIAAVEETRHGVRLGKIDSKPHSGAA